MVTKKVSTTEVSENKNVRIYSVSHMEYTNTISNDVKIKFDEDGNLSFEEFNDIYECGIDPWFVIDNKDIKTFIETLTKYVKEHNPND